MIKENGKDVVVNALGKNRLAYPIKQIRYGYFYTITFSAEPAQVNGLQDKLRLDREVLRFMISHFSIELTAEQKMAYGQGGNGSMTQMIEREMEKEADTTAVTEEKPVKKSVTVPKEEKKVDMDEVKKKLDKILDETDVISGV
jgi:ribosomal protein S6